jgi:GntR family transcriptional regulator, arabinose operon transcriptional repressor
MRASPPKQRKHLEVYSALRRDIESGHWKEGEQLPSEAELVRSFGVSRITVTRAVNDLYRAGLVERIAGSGTFVTRAGPGERQSFGLLIPDLRETEIFEPICRGLMASPLAREHALVWGSAAAKDASKEERAWSLCRQYIARGVSGVFFAPLELTPAKDEANRRILRALDAERIPVVLLDRAAAPYPQSSEYDLVGIDNRRAGYMVTEHLLSQGCRRISFLAVPNAATTVDEREAGYREALFAANAHYNRYLGVRIDPDDTAAVERWVTEQRPDGIVCANDRTAGRLMQALRVLRYHVPEDIRLVGIDDVEYAHLLPVPLTTLRQPTLEMGDAALAAMLERIARPGLPPREIRLPCKLILRESSGAVTEAAPPCVGASSV